MKGAWNGSAALKKECVDRLEERPLASFIRDAIKAGYIGADIVRGQVWNRSNRWRCRSKHGYIVGTVHFYGIRKQCKAHQVIWIASGRRFPANKVLDHINGDRADNRIENLRLLSPEGNVRSRRRYFGEANPAAKLSKQTVEAIRTAYQFRKVTHLMLADRFGVSQSLIAKILQRRLWA